MRRTDNANVPPIGTSDLHLAAHLFEARRLTQARELRGISKAELAERIGKSPAAISQFEGAGLASCKPDPKTLASIAFALGLPLAFFSRKQSAKSLDVSHCHFRSLRATSQRNRRKLVAQGTILSDLAAFLEEHVDLPSERVSKLVRTVHSVEDIEQTALDVRRAWNLGLGPIPNVTRLLEGFGIIVVEIAEGCSDVDAFSTWSDGRPFVFLVMDKGSASRTRFDAGHELGHLVMHTDVSPGDAD